MIREIIKYGRPELVTRSERVEEFDDDLRKLASDMLETMYDAEGVGLAAPQLGINKRLIVVDVTSGRQAGNQVVLVNPEITSSEGSQVGEEGCLSIPGFTANVERPMRVTIQGHDLQGEPLEMEAEEFLARALCHEIDHLEGILYLDRISPLKRQMIKRKISKMMKAGEW
ncbi:MAG TPA: peptide deformylase [Acidobacteriota bacterium]|nr:peptide deformylase [Acidobacteriota bacterium]